MNNRICRLLDAYWSFLKGDDIFTEKLIRLLYDSLF